MYCAPCTFSLDWLCLMAFLFGLAAPYWPLWVFSDLCSAGATLCEIIIFVIHSWYAGNIVVNGSDIKAGLGWWDVHLWIDAALQVLLTNYPLVHIGLHLTASPGNQLKQRDHAKVVRMPIIWVSRLSFEVPSRKCPLCRMVHKSRPLGAHSTPTWRAS